MSDANNPCDAFGPDVVALLRGELSPEEAVPVRAHIAACAACAALGADHDLIRAAAAARPAESPSPASRARLTAALDQALAAADAADRARGPVFRLLDRAGRRYAESRKVRFLTISLGAHAAAAVLLAIHLTVGLPGATAPEDPVIEIATGAPLPPPYPEDPFLGTDGVEVEGVGPMAPKGGVGRIPMETRWPHLDLPLPPSRPVAPAEDPIDGGASFRLYPNAESAAFAGPRFRRLDRERRMREAWGPLDATHAEQTVERGLRYLAAAQNPDGTWSSGRAGDPKAQRERFAGGVTGTVLLAFHADGRTAMRQGPFTETVRRAMGAILRSEDRRTGLLGSFARGPANDRPLCNHAPALAALAEGYALDYGLLPDVTRKELSAVVERAVAATLRAQRDDGSFGYAPDAAQGDASVTLMQVEALDAARRAGFAVDPEALRRAGAWLRERLGADGRLGYRTAGDRSKDATLSAQALPLARALGFDEDARGRMAKAVLEDARGAALEERVLFRSAVLEVVARSAGEEARAVAPLAARLGIAAQTAGGSIGAGRDPSAAAAGDALSTARTVRGLAAAYR